MAGRTTRRLVSLLSPLVPLAAAAAAWRPLLDAYFHSDDFIHLYDLVTLPPAAFLTQVWAGHLYIVRNSVFIALFQLFGPNPGPWFATVLATHLINVLLLQRVLQHLTGDTLLAGAGATLWGTCPFLQGTLGWYAVYGQVLLTTVVLLLTGSLVGHITGGRTLSTGRALVWGMAVVIGGACFGSGLGIAIAFPLATVLALPRDQRSGRALAVLAGASFLILAVYALTRQYGSGFEARARELTSPTTALMALPSVITMTAQLMGFGAYALGVGTLAPDVPPTGWLMGLAVAAAGALAITGWIVADPPMRRAQLALWLLLASVYATTAAGRAAVIEALGSPVLRAALWPRYQYLALALLVLALSAALRAIQSRSAEARGAVRGAAGVWAAFRLLLLVVRPPSIDLHANDRTATATALATIRRTVAATPPGAVARIANRPLPTETIPWLFPGWAALFVIHFPDDIVDGRPVRFLVSEEDWARIQARGGRIASLVERR